MFHFWFLMALGKDFPELTGHYYENVTLMFFFSPKPKNIFNTKEACGLDVGRAGVLAYTRKTYQAKLQWAAGVA